MGKRVHKENCECTTCRSKRGDRPQHKPGCICCICKALRGEAPSGKDHPRYGKSSWCKDLTKKNDKRIKDRTEKAILKNTGQKRSKETKEKMSIARNKRPRESEKTRQKRSNTLKEKYKNGWTNGTHKLEETHKENCSCSFCKQKRGEKVKFVHKDDCTCYKCRAKRGECKGKNAAAYGKIPWNFDKEFYEKFGIKKSFYPYNENFNYKLKKKVRKYYDNCCVVTGMSNEEHKKLYGRSLFVHHWNYNKDTDDPYWMVPVCQTINNLAERDKEAWMSLFGGIVQEKINKK